MDGKFTYYLQTQINNHTNLTISNAKIVDNTNFWKNHKKQYLTSKFKNYEYCIINCSW